MPDPADYGPGYRDAYGRGPLLAYRQDSDGVPPGLPVAKPWAPCLPLDIYGGPEKPVPQGHGSTSVAFWEALLADVVDKKVREQVADQISRKLESVRAAFARVRDGLRVQGDESAVMGERLAELERRIEDLARPAPRRQPVAEELEV